ncbi:NHL repeat containing protein [Oopsacas minuta]|uniref:NHL repeat containing protein n=1 Tax=Oopsacas minuta TaxID=111878 RepID=A0AAV7JRS7_9METZ|nr:NHL repeat containing protein [Oopsacas minuta]
MEEEEELKSMVKQLSNAGNGSHPGNRINAINNQIQHMLSENNSKLLVLDWDLSLIQIIMDKFCKITVKKLDPTVQEHQEDIFTSNMNELSISEHNNPCWLPRETKLYPELPVKNSSIESQFSLILEQKYKKVSSRYSVSIGYKGGRIIPRGVSIDYSTNDMYVADYFNNRIVVFERNETYVCEFTHNKMLMPTGIHVSGEADRVYITSQGRNSVQAYKLNGTFLKEITHYGSSCGDFDNPAGITMDSSQRIYVCDQGRDRVVVFSNSLVFITVLTSQLTNPVDVAMCENDIAVLHHGDSEYCVSFFTRGGKFIREVVKQGPNKQKISSPLFFCIDSDGNIMITDTDNECVKIYRADGYHICNIEAAGISCIALLNDGYFVTLCNTDNDQIHISNISYQ